MTIYKNVLNHIETEDGVETIEENVNDILARKENQYKGWRCWAGIQSVNITSDGTLTSASCNNEQFGNIYDDEEISLLKEPHLCKKDWCACAANINITKIKSDKYRRHTRENNGG